MLIDLALRGINLGCRGDHVVPFRHTSSLVGMAKVASARKLFRRLPRMFCLQSDCSPISHVIWHALFFPIFGIFNCMAIG